MKDAMLPVPGVVFGAYPERRDGERRRAAGDGRARLRAPATADAMARVAAACRRALGVEVYGTQLAAARVMLEGNLAELATGEGKTFAGAVAAATAALAGVPVHVVTANDYLVERDAAALRPLYAALGLSVGTVTQGCDPAARRAAYACNVAYATAKELAFDYLRDLVSGRRRGLEERAARIAGADSSATLLRGLCMAIVDEADSVLIDEARMPLVLSKAPPPHGDGARHRRAWDLSAQLAAGNDYVLDAEVRRVRLTGRGQARLREMTRGDAVEWLSARHCDDLVAIALAARHLFVRDRDYLVRDGSVLIIDETTGRAAPGRAWSQGLHQLVEVKEGCQAGAAAVPIAQITYQRFFRRYLRLGGMSGTLVESRAELREIYGLDVVRIPLRQPGRRETRPPRVFAGEEELRAALTRRVAELHASGRPVLVGTGSVAESEELSRRLAAAGLSHTVLNARQDAQEASIVSRAGMPGAITVSTSMAGRGTDIAVDEGARRLGGLHVICCQQNHSRRIDRQLLGRCARRGEPGSTEEFVTLDGPLLASRPLARLLRHFVRGEARRLRWLGIAMLRAAQRTAAQRQRAERRALLRSDEETQRWFSFSGPER